MSTHNKPSIYDVQQRRMKVAMMIATSKSRDEIMETIGCSTQTLTNDIAALREMNKDWLADTAKEGFIFENRMAIEKLKYMEQELAELRVRCQSDVKTRVVLEKAIMDNLKLQLEIYGKGPMLYALSEMLKRQYISTTEQGEKVLQAITTKEEEEVEPGLQSS